MKKYLFVIFLVLIYLNLSSCNSEDPVTNINPSNLLVDVNIAEDGSGVVNVIATAENTVGYEFYPGDNSSTDPIFNTDGAFSYTYTTTGIYNVEVRALGSNNKYINKENQISVQVGAIIDPEDGYSTPLSYPNMKLVWADEFSGTSLNLSDWTYEIGTGNNGWGNNELQYYRQENTSVGDGYLTIEAKKESYQGRSYTSSRLVTKDKQSFQYGRIDIRAILPKGKGIWPALWMLGANIDAVGWPKCGETDIMEMIGGTADDNTVYGTLHWDNNGDYACTCDQDNSYSLANEVFADKFHVFSIIWDSNSIQWFVDDNLFKTVDISVSELSEFQQNFFFIFNVAVGGNWPGNPDSSTLFPQQMVVDYVRVFQNN